MVSRIFREILVLIFGLSLAPAVIVAVLIHEDALWQGYQFFINRTLAGDPFPESGFAAIFLKWISPYLILQAIRAFIWSKQSLTGRKWANLYFAVLLAAMSVWFLYPVWDLFYFMFALGDLPAEFMQFLELESQNLALFGISLTLAIYCFTVFLNPERRSAATK